MIDIAFLKKLRRPTFSLDFFSGKPGAIVGIDLGVHSAKVVQLKYEGERARLETYGELLSAGYLKTISGTGGGFLNYLDSDIAALLKDLLKEAGVTTPYAALSVPANASFVTTITFPRLDRKEIAQAIEFEARKYIPIPISEVVLDWDINEPSEERNTTEVLLVAVPREVIEKLKRVADLTGLKPHVMEVENFSLVRSLVGRDPAPTAVLNMGYLSTTLVMVDKGRVRAAHNFSRGSQGLTRALESGLGVSEERAETIKREVGLSERMEEREITSVIQPLIEALFIEIERTILLYNRKAERKIQKINLTGGGSNLKGITDYTSTKFGIEVLQGNPLARIVTPAFLQPKLREIAPSFSTAVGLALHGITTR